MRWLLYLILLLFLVGCTTEKVEKEDVKMKLKSNDFNEGEMIPRQFTCQGEDINPQLSWEDVPAGVKSFALIFDDPDAPMGTWVHWLVKEIPADVRGINQNTVPGNEVVNSFGKEGYGGPCPPSGVHRYVFKLYALDVSSFEASGKADFYSKVEEHAIAKAELIGKYIKS